MALRVVFLLLLFFTPGVYAQQTNATDVDLKLGARLDLKRFGGYDMDLQLTVVDPMKVSILMIDRTKMITKTWSHAAAGAYSNGNGSFVGAAANSGSTQVPTTTPYEIPLTNGIRVEGSVMERMYLLYQDDNMSIYYQDTSFTPMGAYRIRVISKASKGQ